MEMETENTIVFSPSIVCQCDMEAFVWPDFMYAFVRIYKNEAIYYMLPYSLYVIATF